ncbi:class II aldolase/adducin family protein [Rhizorhabdus sp.]|uniref:class II aldolase/adducin family protein n=1 Tax=Rhizorhabdus sp. TaxID=1968843 RepID=UPI0019869256|nr:class II aldolase/adducin family protein [Rhizorhabdus sp.]MBD3759594.1 class II aldolase/adducin family protein [Rhizorhabdus sp.]
MSATVVVPRRDFLRGTLGFSAMLLLPDAARATPRSVREAVVEELVTANRILTTEGIVDGFGHISRRDPERQDRFLMARARAPGLVEEGDILEFDLSGAPTDAGGRRTYIERFIHAAIYSARPDVNSIIHDHSKGLLPFTVSKRPLRALTAQGAPFDTGVPVWDVRDKFGDSTAMAVTNMEMGQDLARTLGSGPAVLMRGHGAVLAGPSIRTAVLLAIMIETEASVQIEALKLGDLTYLSPGEIKMTRAIIDPNERSGSANRLWEEWCRKAGRPFVEKGY